MDIKVEKNNIILHNVPDFDLTHIFECGQAFRFDKVDTNTYAGVAFGKALTVSQSDDSVILYNTSYEDYKTVWHSFFDLDNDYSKIKSSLACDDYMQEATAFGNGIRILRQDLWETIISFIISASNNVPRIKGIIERLCQNFGDEIKYMNNTYYSFPTPQKLASLTLEDLSVIRAGFRDKYILDAAKKIYSGEILLDDIKSMSTPDAKNALMRINGIGNKVSDCILLFGLGRQDSFPVDVWIKRIMEYCYFDTEQPISVISEYAEKKFGVLGGYAQQYLFFWAREKKIGI